MNGARLMPGATRRCEHVSDRLPLANIYPGSLAARWASFGVAECRLLCEATWSSAAQSADAPELWDGELSAGR